LKLSVHSATPSTNRQFSGLTVASMVELTGTAGSVLTN